MTTNIFLVLLTSCSLITSLVCEGLKKFLDSLKIKYSSNILVLIIAIIVGVFFSIIYYLSAGIEITFLNIVYSLLLGIANWIGAMIGYDKVKQTIEQLGV